MSEAAEGDAPLTIPRSLFKKKRLEIPHEMGVGTMAWGDEEAGFVSDPKQRRKQDKFNIKDLQGAFDALVSKGLVFFDTSDMYAYKSMDDGLSAEQLLGKFEDESPEDRVMVAAKYMPVLWTNWLIGGPFRGGRRAVVKSLERSLDRLGMAYVDLYQVHFPFPYIGGMDALAEGMAMAYNRGLCRAVGVSNFNAQQTRDFKEKLEKHGVELFSNQFEYSLINQDKADDGTLAECKRLGVTPIAHTPLGKGLATGVYTASNPTGGKMGAPKYGFRDLEPLMPVHIALAEVAKMVMGRLNQDEDREAGEPLRVVTTTQVALNYIRAKGLVPIPGVKTKKEALEVAGCLGWHLRAEDVEILDEAYKAYKKGTGGRTVKRRKAPDRTKRALISRSPKKSRGTGWIEDLNKGYD